MKSIAPLLAALLLAAPGRADQRPPNLVLMFTDDQGYGDVGCYGAEGFTTPHLDRLAREGTRFTDFYVSSPVCSASRAALMTGCYHRRVGITGALGPFSKIGLNPDETTLAEICKQRGYATAAFGKWHLGRPEPFLPTAHGFDEYFGIPYSNDMWPFHPGVRHLPMEKRLEKWPHLPLIEGTEVIDPQLTPEDQQRLTNQLAARAVDFIDRHHQQPFFLYLAHPQPHVPLFVSDAHAGMTGRGLYGDVIAEIDASMGRILGALERHGIDDDTLVMFATDNGPWLSYGTHGGSAGPLREGKGTCWEGGIRVPFLARWPGKIPAGSVISEPAATIDLLPTLAKLIDADLPQRKIDGKDIGPLLLGEPDARSPHDALFFHYSGELQAMRSGKWKLILPHRYRSLAGRKGKDDGTPVGYEMLEAGLELYDLVADPGETTELSARRPEVVESLMKKVEAMRAELGDELTGAKGSARRAPGRL